MNTRIANLQGQKCEGKLRRVASGFASRFNSLLQSLQCSLLSASSWAARKPLVTEPGLGRTHRAYLWSYATSEYDELKTVVYDFADGRGGDCGPELAWPLRHRASSSVLLDHNVIVHGSHAASVFRDHFRKITSVFGRRRAAQPHNSIFVGVDADLGESRHMLCCKFRFHFRRDG